MFIGFGLLTVGVLGMLSIARGNPGVFAPLEDTRRAVGLGDAGGIVGAIGAGPLSKVVSPYGAFVIDAGLAAIAEIDTIIREHDIACDFEWVSGYRHAPGERAGAPESDYVA